MQYPFAAKQDATLAPIPGPAPRISTIGEDMIAYWWQLIRIKTEYCLALYKTAFVDCRFYAEHLWGALNDEDASTFQYAL